MLHLSVIIGLWLCKASKNIDILLQNANYEKSTGQLQVSLFNTLSESIWFSNFF